MVEPEKIDEETETSGFPWHVVFLVVVGLMRMYQHLTWHS
jgi:hypothetical protein